jgi:protein-S-isoprenylcysteine O-methyltransferase
MRHPSYFGWFYYTVGTQIILTNPICAVLFGFAAFKFFAGRIP